MFHHLFRFLLNCFYKPFIIKYLKKDRYWEYLNIKIKIIAGVFHPRFFFSTKLMLKYISTLKIENKNVLELGAGTGLISIYCAKRNGNIVASDINKTAIENIAMNCKLNAVSIKIILSDLFANVQPTIFDLIIINPPFYKKKPKSETEHAWYCGQNGEYFEDLFFGIGNFMNNDSLVLMVLSEDCDLEMIFSFAKINNLKLEEKIKKTIWFETNYIFLIKKII